MKRTNKKGISLIVLVITIIVMIILAAAIIITLSNSGIIGKANEAVELTNLKQVQQMASVLWSDAYLEANGNITKEELYNKIIAGLTEAKIDTTKYIVNVTTSGVSVVLRGEQAQLNKHGFYFDTLYVADMGNGEKCGIVTHENGTGELYGGIENMSEGDYPLTMLYEVVYEDGKAIFYDEDLPEPEMTFKFSEGGLQAEANGLFFEKTKFNATSQEIHGVYVGRTYSLYDQETGTSMSFMIDSNNKITITEGGHKMEVENAVLSADNHLIVVDDGESGIAVMLSVDGRTLYAGDFELTLDGASTGGSDTGTTGTSHSGTIPIGGTYYVGVTSTTVGDYTGATATYTAGDSFPTAVNDGDIYVYGDYEYRYNYGNMIISWYNFETISLAYGYTATDGWGVCVLDKTKSSYGKILESINNKPITATMYTFHECESLATVPDLPSTVENISGVFCDTAITKAPAIPNSVKAMNETFSDCTKLTDISAVVIPEGVKSIGGIFSDCTSLKDISTFVIPEGVTHINSLFNGCTSLSDITTLTIPNTVKSMSMTFYKCTSLVDVSGLVIPTSVEDLFGVFANCTNLKTAPIIPEGVKKMGETFYNCNSLTGTITINATPTEYNMCFFGCSNDITLIGSSTVLQELAATSGGNVYDKDGNLLNPQ